MTKIHGENQFFIDKSIDGFKSGEIMRPARVME